MPPLPHSHSKNADPVALTPHVRQAGGCVFRLASLVWTVPARTADLAALNFTVEQSKKPWSPDQVFS